MKLTVLAILLCALCTVSASAKTYNWGTEIKFSTSKNYLVITSNRMYINIAMISRLWCNQSAGTMTLVTADGYEVTIKVGSALVLNRFKDLLEMIPAKR